MAEVYVVHGHDAYESGSTLGIFSYLEIALEYNTLTVNYEYYYIERFALDTRCYGGITTHRATHENELLSGADIGWLSKSGHPITRGDWISCEEEHRLGRLYESWGKHTPVLFTLGYHEAGKE